MNETNIENLITEKTPQELEELIHNQNNIIPKNTSKSEAILPTNSQINYTLPKELKECKILFDWLNVSDGKTHPLVSLVSVFTIASAITARGYFTQTKASTPLYIILIGKTGLGKNTIYKTPTKILDEVHQGNKVITSKITSEGAIDDLFRQQNIIIHIIDEFGDLLNHMLNDKGGWLQAVASKMKNLYSLTSGILKSNIYSSAGGKAKKSKAFEVKNPCYGITGITTKQQLLSTLDASKIHDGFLNRFIIFDAYGIQPQFNDFPIYDTPISILNHIKSIKISQIINNELLEQLEEQEEFERKAFFNAELSYFDDDTYKTILLSTEADEYYRKFIGDADIPNTDIEKYCMNDEDESKRAISTRWRENTIRLATALTAYEKKRLYR